MRLKTLIQTAALITLTSAAATAAPARPHGLMGLQVMGGRAFTLVWEPVSGDTAGAPAVAGYNIYRRAAIQDAPVRINPDVVSVPVYADTPGHRLYYYSVRAVDANGAESPESCLVDSTQDANLTFVAEDGRTRVTVPGAVASRFRRSGNALAVPLTLRFAEEANAGAPNAVRTLRFDVVRSDTGETVTDALILGSGLEIHIGYNVVGGQVATGAPGSALGAETLSGATPDRLSLYWWNGLSWIQMGGARDSRTDTIGARMPALGTFQLRVAPPATALALDATGVFPSVLTPNGDGRNDRLHIVLQNPVGAAVSGQIVDLGGREVASLESSMAAGAVSTLVWNGRDWQGAAVPAGLYVYRVSGDGQVFTGTVSVAR